MGDSVTLIVAHPDLPVSRANRAMIDAARDVDGVTVHDLYAAYPDLFIDGAAERERLDKTNAIVLQHPIYWYSAPGLLKEWLDRTLTAGWAYGRNGDALKGKKLLSSITTGSAGPAYSPEGVHGRAIADYLRPYEQTAKFCGMQWCEPLVFHHARMADDTNLGSHVATFTRRLRELAGAEA